MTGTATVGTRYGLVDPRDGKPRYIGQTRQRLAVRSRGKYAAGEGPVASVSVTPGTVGDTVLPGRWTRWICSAFYGDRRSAPARSGAPRLIVSPAVRFPGITALTPVRDFRADPGA